MVHSHITQNAIRLVERRKIEVEQDVYFFKAKYGARCFVSQLYKKLIVEREGLEP